MVGSDGWGVARSLLRGAWRVACRQGLWQVVWAEACIDLRVWDFVVEMARLSRLSGVGIRLEGGTV